MTSDSKRMYKLVVLLEVRQLEHVGFEGSKASMDRTKKNSTGERDDTPAVAEPNHQEHI
jgi:hypothetical protein